MCLSEIAEMEESKTIRAFKSELIKIMPYFPNTKEVQTELLEQHLSSVMLHYLHWASRLIPVRPRVVSIEPYLLQDSRWSEYENDVRELLRKVELGEDLTEHLSNKVLTKGYTPKDYILAKGDAWTDKDQLLNTKGFHHLHLHAGKSKKGSVVLFAQVSRDKFMAVALFDHSVFDYDNHEMSEERRRMWAISDHIAARELPPNSVYMSYPITTSGHPLHINSMTHEYWHVISQIDHKVGSREFAEEMFTGCSTQMPKKPKFKWLLYGLDLGLLETKTSNFFVFRRGYL